MHPHGINIDQAPMRWINQSLVNTSLYAKLYHINKYYWKQRQICEILIYEKVSLSFCLSVCLFGVFFLGGEGGGGSQPVNNFFLKENSLENIENTTLLCKNSNNRFIKTDSWDANWKFPCFTYICSSKWMLWLSKQHFLSTCMYRCFKNYHNVIE